MFRELTRKNQQLPMEECLRLLREETRGVLSVQGEDGYPYGMPMNHWYDDRDGCLYFHSGRGGHRTDGLRGCDKVSFCVVDKDELVAEKLTTYFRSVVVFGRVRILEDAEEKRAAVTALSRRYFPEMEEKIQQEASGALKNL